MEEVKTNRRKIFNIGIAAEYILVSLIFNFVRGREAYEIAGNVIISALLVIVLIYTIEKELLKDRFIFVDCNNISKFYIVFYIAVPVSVFFSYIPEIGWPFLVIFVCMTLLSSETVGFVASVCLLSLSVLLCPQPSYLMWVVYAVPGIFCSVLFSETDSDFYVKEPICSSLLVQFVFLCIGNVLFSDSRFSVGLFLLPVINIFISAVLLLILLKIISSVFVFQNDDIYTDILDPEYDLLKFLKDTSKEDYDHSIYTAVLCSKMALSININEQLSKACGYYHRIGLVRGDNTFENIEGVLKEYGFPDAVIDILKEYSLNKDNIRSKEACLLLFADTVITSFKILFSKRSDSTLDYDKIIETIFAKKINSGILDECNITYSEMKTIKQTLIEQKLFYDFLR